ncbi:hypothetical protein AB3G45_00260 [Shinella sp. S4-D37]|uniref:hypothetical protein n=1 Tax=Shinella sp. S4-D37 TaxID=3161999 RepID=UPI003465374F
MHVNTCGGADGTVPLGGVRQSGNGHDKSLHALDKYLDLKTAWIQLKSISSRSEIASASGNAVKTRIESISGVRRKCSSCLPARGRFA